jgi:Protein of unknown function (DUF1822)
LDAILLALTVFIFWIDCLDCVVFELFSAFTYPPTMTLPPSLSATTVPLHPRHHQLARQFAQPQPTPEKATQVYRNTLAVLALKDCLEWVDIVTDFAGSDSANPVLQLIEDVADLKLPGLGRLECRPIAVDADHCLLPAPIHDDRLGVVVVELSAPYQTAQILGFTPQVAVSQIACADLLPLEDLFLHLDCLQDEAAATSQTAVTPQHLLSETDSTLQPARPRLSQWLTNLGTDAVAGTHGVWQAISTMLNLQTQWVPGLYGMRSSPSIRFRHLEQLVEQLYVGQGLTLASVPSEPGSVSAALVHLVQTCTNAETRWQAAELLWTMAPEQLGVRRILDLGLLFARQPLSLMVAILPPAEQTSEFSVLVRVAPAHPSNLAYLPPGLSLAILREDGQLGLQTQARERDNFIQIKLQATLGETFSIQLRSESHLITEYFEV